MKVRSFSAIVKITVKSAWRSWVFLLLLVILLLAVGIIPLSISGEKAQDFIHVSLLYSLWSVGSLLSLSSIWLGCLSMTQDLESYQLHMVAAKPVSRITIFFGKWCGVLLVNGVLLLLALAAVYFTVIWRFEHSDRFDRSSRQSVADEILVGRRVFMPKRPDYEKMIAAVFYQQMQFAASQGRRFSDAERDKILKNIREKITDKSLELAPGDVWTWTYTDLPAHLDRQPLFLRYRPFLGKISSEDQRETYLRWLVWIADGKNRQKTPYVIHTGTGMGAEEYFGRGEQVFSGAFHEKNIPAQWNVLGDESELSVSVCNLDRYGGKHYYQSADGPKLLVKVCGFEGNFFRAALVMLLQLALLTGLACALGGCFTMPTAVFMMVSYLLFGAFSSILTDSEFYVANLADNVGQQVAGMLLKVIVPLQVFDVTGKLSDGELIELSFIGDLCLWQIIVRGLPIILIGLFCYRRKELALAVRK